jgi:hypothetical protein
MHDHRDETMPESVNDDHAESTSTEPAQVVAVQVYLRVRAHPQASASILRVLAAESSEIDGCRRIKAARVEIDGRTFKFNAAGDERTTQAELFACVGQPICSSVMNGYNGTVLAYGQTGSGKTREWRVRRCGWSDSSYADPLSCARPEQIQ